MLTSCTTESRSAARASQGPAPAWADAPADAPADAAAELADGLAAHQARISPKFLYDGLGSKLFEAICELPEYYPTRTEAALFERYGAEIARACGVGTTLIDLGAGNCAKAASLFPRLCPSRYVAVDISADFVRDALARLRARFPQIAMEALGLDFSRGLALPDSVPARRRLFFYPGSSLGNFTPPEARAFLQRLRKHAGPDGALLIGLDLVKEKAVLDAAYDDALGVTAAFNLNVLRHVNRLLGADFDVGGWRHEAFYNEACGRVEMHLEARSAQRVRWPGGGRDFAAGERIHTENSYKYRQADAIALLEQSGFEATRIWLDARCPFAVIHAQAAN